MPQSIGQNLFNLIKGLKDRVGYLFTEFLKKALAGIEFWAVGRNIADVDMGSTDDLFGTMRSGLVLVEGNACFYFVGNKVQKCLMAFWGHIGKKRGNQVAPQGFDCNVEITKVVTEFRCPLRANATGCPLPLVRSMQAEAHFIAEPSREFQGVLFRLNFF